MKAILKRELSSFFHSATAYIIMAIFFGFSGYFFVATCFMGNTSSLAYTFSNMFMIIIFVIPILTMKSFSEEKRQRTDQALLTSPVSLLEIVLGKFIGAFILFCICCSIFIVYGLVISFYTVPDWAVIFCTLLGFLLMGAALISIEIFISALTESQVIAAIVSMAIGFVIYLLNSIASAIDIKWIANIIKKISFTTYLSNFTNGLLDIAGIVYFLSLTVLFIFLTIRIFEKKRWS